MPLMWQEQSLQMEWCLDCHRQPGAVRAAARRGVPRRLRAASRPARAGQAPGRRVSDSEADELLDVSPMNKGSGFKVQGSGFWRTLDERAGDPAFRERLSQRVSVAPARIEAITDPVARRTFLEADGRVAGARRRHRLHAPAGREDRSLRPATRGDDSGQAAVLRDGDAARRRRDRPARREPRRTADQDRRQSAAPGQPRRDRHLRAGRHARPLRSRSVANADEPRRDPAVAAIPRRDPRGARRAAAAAGRRPPHPDRVGQLADARRADSRSAQRASRRRSGISGIPRAATTRAPARSSPSANTSTRSTDSSAPT